MAMDYYRVVAIDPALDKMGISVLDIDLATNQVFIRHTEQIDGVMGCDNYPEVIASMGTRTAKLTYHFHYLYRFFCQWQPHSIVHESPFLGRFPQSYAALVEVVLSIRMAVIKYSMLADFDSVDPPSAKKAVGVSGKSKDKEEVMAAIKKLPRVVYDAETLHRLEFVSEHEADSVAVGYWKIEKLLKSW